MSALPEIVLHTERLILRLPQPSDHEHFAAFIGDSETAEFVGGLQSPHMAWRALMAMIGSWASGGVAMFSVVERSSGDWVGRVGPWSPWGWPGDEVGWGIRRASWGLGYAKEADSAAMDFVVDELGWDTVIHSIDPNNHRSRRVAEKLASRFLREDRLPAPFNEKPIDIWGQSAAEWRARRR